MSIESGFDSAVYGDLLRNSQIVRELSEFVGCISDLELVDGRNSSIVRDGEGLEMLRITTDTNVSPPRLVIEFSGVVISKNLDELRADIGLN